MNGLQLGGWVFKWGHCWVDLVCMTVSTEDDFGFFAQDQSRSANPVGPPPPSVSQGRMGFTPTAPTAPVGPVPKASRWAKSDTTFGPIGRVLSSIGLIVPFLLLVAAGVFTFDPFVLGGAGIWAALMVMGLRQVWQLVAHHHRR